MSILATFTLLTLLVAPGGVQPGLGKHYAPGMFRVVAANRGMTLRWDAVAGFAAVPDCSLVDARHPWAVAARFYEPARRGWEPWRWYQIVDCVAPADRASHRRRSLLIEVDAATAQAGGWAWDYVRQVGAGHTDAVVGPYRRIGGK